MIAIIVAIIASVAFGVAVVAGDVYHEGISGITDADIANARRLGYVVKLLAIAERTDVGEVSVRVHPAMVPVDHPLASVSGSFNAVFCEGDAAGQLMLYGRGAGGRPTASAVLGDLVDAGHTVLLIEHNLDVIKTADWIVDLGPGAGPDGGRVVAMGTPEDVARVGESLTGQYLARMLAQRLNVANTYLADIKRQYAGHGNHLEMVGDILQSMINLTPTQVSPGSDRQSDPRI